MDKEQRQQIDRENRAEVQRARTGLSNRDWGIVFGALIIAIAVLGFIYTSDNTGVDTADLEPAAGVTAPATSTSYDEPGAADPATNSSFDNSTDRPANLNQNPNPVPSEQPAME